MSDLRYWIELREPRRVPELKGGRGFTVDQTKQFIREVIDVRPQAYITVWAVCSDGIPYVSDGPEWLMIADGRSRSNALRHIKSTRDAHSDHRRQG